MLITYALERRYDSSSDQNSASSGGWHGLWKLCQDDWSQFAEAASQFNYIECHPEGKNAQPELCETAKIQGFPTWEINGQLYQGEKTLQELADLSGYQGSRNFQNAPKSGH